MPKLNYFLFDVFTEQQFGGNPLAVFPNADSVSSQTMQRIANELNLSETTFIQTSRSVNSDCAVRIFTPQVEMPMAGHPTIGTAYAILKHQLLTPRNSNYLVFDEGIGPIQVDYTLDDERQPSSLYMHQPLPQFGDTVDRTTAAEILSLGVNDVSDEHPVQIVSCGVPFIVVPLNSLDAVTRSSVRIDRVESMYSRFQCSEFLAFSLQTERPTSDVHCRMFAPRLGVFEDPATGGAHGPLGSYLYRHGLSTSSRIVSEQGFEMGRPSTISVRLETDGEDITDVLVGGECVEVGTGTIAIHRP